MLVTERVVHNSLNIKKTLITMIGMLHLINIADQH